MTEPTFTSFINLAADRLGAEAVSCSDDFFAEKENLLKPGRGIFIPGKYTERGKWMDGWESRRKRDPGHDWCIVQLATKCEASWKYNSIELDFETTYQEIRTSLLKTFAFHKSLSVQHTLYAMAEDVLKKVKEIDEISLVMPNKHHILFNLEQFGMTNENDVFIATDEPYGYITGTVARKAGTA